MRVLVTGATGFIGGRLMTHLKDAGYTPVALVRAQSDTRDLEAADVDIFVGDLQSGVGLEAACAGAGAIVHAAGGGYARHADDYLRNNTRTTERLLDVALAHCPNLERFILISSAAATGPVVNGEATAPLSQYGFSKALAEACVLKYQSKFPVTILRPVAVYGRGDTRLIPLINSVRRGIALFPKNAGLSAWLHVDDCCSAIVCALGSPGATGQIYQLDDGKQQTSETIVKAIATGLDCPEPRVLRIPVWLITLIAYLIELKASLFGTPALLTRDKLKDIGRSAWHCAGETAMEELNWQPQRIFASAMAETARKTGPPAKEHTLSNTRK